MTRLLEGRTAVITGPAQGIGLEAARLLDEHGARVVLADRAADLVAAAAKEVASDGTALGVARDVTSEGSVTALLAHTLESSGCLDVFVNNAGIPRDGSLLKMTPGHFDAVTEVHLKGTWLGLRAASAQVRQAERGSIINMSSLSGKSGNPGQTNYSAAGAGIVGLTKAAAKELAHHGVRVNAVQPGLIRTPMTSAMPAEVFAERETAIPMQRAGEPREVAGVVLFLASDLSSYMTGSVPEVGGGRLM